MRRSRKVLIHAVVINFLVGACSSMIHPRSNMAIFRYNCLPLRMTQTRFLSHTNAVDSAIVFIEGFSFEIVDVYIDGMQKTVRILEATSEGQDAFVERALNCEKGAVEEDPYGFVRWPAATVVSNRLCQLDLNDKTILELGAGTGLVSIVAWMRGAKKIIASDYNPLTLQVIKYAIGLQTNRSLSLNDIETLQFDVKDLSKPLPEADYIVIADLLYDKSLGVAVAQRLIESIQRGSKAIIGDSPCRVGRPHMLNELKRYGIDSSFKFIEGSSVTGNRNSLISAPPLHPENMLRMGILEL